MTEYARRSARVILVDARDRVLLMHGYREVEHPELGSLWFTPGGGVHDGEPLAEAAARELREETGLAVPPEALGDAVAYVTGWVDASWATGWMRDELFFLRVDEHEVDIAGFEELERSHFLEHRWWSLDDLVATEDVVVPYGLPGLLADLLAGRVPPVPVEMPRHRS